MNKTKKRIFRVLAVFIIVIICAITLFFISKSRNFQFFGNIITSLPNSDKRIALTFDDGPTENTEAILDKLNELDIKASFFVCGYSIDERPDDAKAIIKAGHDIGNHSYSHKRMVLKSYSFYKDEIDKTNDLIREIGYEREIFFRPPNGKKLFVLPYYLNKINMTTVMWDIEPETILGFDATPDEIAQYIINNVKSGSIILLHPMYNAENILPVLDIIVSELKKLGYTFDTISNLYNEYQ